MIWLDAITDKLPGPMHLRVRGRSMLPTLRPGDEVVVHPVTAEALAPGDWVVVRGAQGVFLHRYLGQRHGRILTKGDGHMGFDPAWPPDAVLGRVVEAQRDGRCFYQRGAGQLRRERVLTAGHHIIGGVWGVLRRVKALLLALCATLFAVALVWAAVTLTSFTAEVVANSIVLKWETASETDNLGYRIVRSLTEDGIYAEISDFIPSLDEGAGASYIYTDTEVTPGVTYYYKVQDLPASGGAGYNGPISATVPSATPTPTPTATPTPTPSPTPTPNPNVSFWADKTDLTAGECTTLHWETNNITAVFFDGVGVTGDGQRQFCPCATESHTLSVKYTNGTTENFTIKLNVTGQCSTAVATTTPAVSPLETPVVGATATPTPSASPTSTSSSNLLPADLAATASTEAFIATATASTEASMATTTASAATRAATQPTVQNTVQPSDPGASPPATLTPSSEVREESAAATSRPTRGPVAGESDGVSVEDMLSIWVLIVGGILGAGFIGAGILMWKRQQ